MRSTVKHSVMGHVSCISELNDSFDTEDQAIIGSVAQESVSGIKALPTRLLRDLHDGSTSWCHDCICNIGPSL